MLGTALAFVIYYELIAGVGAARAALVSYLAPGVALFYGAIFLDEAITVAAIVGLALILAGVAIASRPKRIAAPLASRHRAFLTARISWRVELPLRGPDALPGGGGVPRPLRAGSRTTTRAASPRATRSRSSSGVTGSASSTSAAGPG